MHTAFAPYELGLIMLGLYCFKVGKQAGGLRTLVHILSEVFAIVLGVVAII